MIGKRRSPKPLNIGSITYKDGLPWKVRLALWIAPVLRDEIAHWDREVKRVRIQADAAVMASREF
jgi:hypothetical protein